jgi:hypothetical protein
LFKGCPQRLRRMEAAAVAARLQAKLVIKGPPT